VEQTLGKDQLDSLAEDMEDEFEDAMAGDFQGPLYENLRQVFAGAIKPETARDSEPVVKKARSTGRKSA
jgi:hypothetical protein